MKNKYAAIAFGLVLTISSCPVYAAENTTETTASAEENGNAAEAEENTLLGFLEHMEDGQKIFSMKKR